MLINTLSKYPYVPASWTYFLFSTHVLSPLSLNGRELIFIQQAALRPMDKDFNFTHHILNA
jgi:hypothetical protein